MVPDSKPSGMHTEPGCYIWSPSDEYFCLRGTRGKETKEWLCDLPYSILSDPENKWHRCQKLSRTNYKPVALYCASPCEILHYIALYCTCSSDCILLYAEWSVYCILLYLESLDLILFYWFILMEYFLVILTIWPILIYSLYCLK